MCRVGSDADGPGREHWTAMLGNPRKPIEHWHQLVEVSVRVTAHVQQRDCSMCTASCAGTFIEALERRQGVLA